VELSVNQFGLLSYGTAFVALAFLSILLAAAPRRRNETVRRLLLAVATSAVWALAVLASRWQAGAMGWLVVVLELLRDGTWLFALLGLAPAALRSPLRWVTWSVWSLWVIACVVWRPVSEPLAMGGFIVALLALLLLEQVYRNASEQARRDLKFLAIGIGGIFTFDIFLYAQAELLGSIDAVAWHARGFVNALLVPLLAIGARRLPSTDLRVFVSRQVTFYTTTFLAVGVYLLVMAATGYAIREFGGAWGESAREIFLVGAFALLIVLITSAAMRQRLRVFVSKHFYNNKYDYRIEWLRFIKTLSGSNATDVQRTSVQAVAQTIESPGGLLYTIDDTGRTFVPAAGWPVAIADLPDLTPLTATEPLVQFMRERRWIVDLRELAASPAKYDGLAVPAWLGAPRWRLVSPVFRLDALTGFIILCEPHPSFELSFEDRDLLNTMGQHVATLLAQHDADRRVAELSQFETYNRLTAFVMHDLKNCAAQLSLVVGNAVKHRHNPEFIDDAIATIANTSERMTRLMEQLTRRGGDLRASPPVPLAEAVAAAVDRCQSRRPRPELVPGAASGCQVAAEREQLVAVIEHVVRNAQDATSESGSVRVDIAGVGDRVQVIVSDDGVGMDAEFVRQRLFQPFHSTKGSKGMGIGAYQAREFARSLGGDVEVDSQPGAGTRFSLILPVAS
jgi:putative PEP-CTERM system histidine kinase